MKRIVRTLVVVVFAASAACGSTSGEGAAQSPDRDNAATSTSGMGGGAAPGEGSTPLSPQPGLGEVPGQGQLASDSGTSAKEAAGVGGQGPAKGPGQAAPAGQSRTSATTGPVKAPDRGRSSEARTDGAPTFAPGSAPSGQAAVKSEILLGSVGTEGGALGRVLLPILAGARAWVSSVNAKGGLDGHPVRLITADDGGDTNRALVLVKEMVEKQQVVAFLGQRMINTLAAVTPYLEEKGVPLLDNSGGNPEEDRSQMVFGFGPRAVDGVAWGTVAGLVSLTDKRKVALFYCREAPICPFLGKRIEQLQKQMGIQIVYSAQISLVQPDFTAEVIQARNAGAEALSTVGDTPTIIRLAKSAHRQGYFPLITGPPSITDQDFIRNGGKDVEGALIGSFSPDVYGSPLTAEYRDIMAKYQPGLPLGGPGVMPWLAGKVLEKYANRLPARPTSKDFIDLFYSIHGETLGGLIVPTTFTRGQGNGEINKCAVPLMVTAGKYVSPRGDEYSCLPGWKPMT